MHLAPFVMGTLGGFPNLPALWLRRAKPASAYAVVWKPSKSFQHFLRQPAASKPAAFCRKKVGPPFGRFYRFGMEGRSTTGDLQSQAMATCPVQRARVLIVCQIGRA